MFLGSYVFGFGDVIISFLFFLCCLVFVLGMIGIKYIFVKLNFVND